MKIDKIVATWQARGIVVIPGFLGLHEATDLRRICDHVLEQSIAEEHRRAELRNIAYLTEPRYFFGREADLLKLIEFIAADGIVSLLTGIAGEMPLFHNTQYFYNPLTNSHDGEWHRDTQFLAYDHELERRRMMQTTGVHFRVAFLPDRQLEYVAGSEQRWDSPEELAIRKGDNPTPSDMPGGERIEVGPGDACLFHGWGIHRGTYRREVLRRTLDIIYGWGGACDWAPPPPTCFRDQYLFARLSPGAQKFFDYFIRSYQEVWKSAV